MALLEEKSLACWRTLGKSPRDVLDPLIVREPFATHHALCLAAGFFSFINPDQKIKQRPLSHIFRKEVRDFGLCLRGVAVLFPRDSRRKTPIHLRGM